MNGLHNTGRVKAGLNVVVVCECEYTMGPDGGPTLIDYGPTRLHEVPQPHHAHQRELGGRGPAAAAAAAHDDDDDEQARGPSMHTRDTYSRST